MLDKNLETLYNSKQALNNIRYNYFESRREENTDIEHFWFDKVKEELKDKEKKDKALKIIVGKNVQIILLKNTKDFETYNRMLGATFNKRDIKKMSLTQEEYDLLKEVLL